MFGFGTIGQFAIGQAADTAAEVITLDKWFVPFSVPIRFPARLQASEQQFSAFNPQPFVPFNWFYPFTEPARIKRGLLASLQQALAMPARLLPNPNITGALSATEIKDTA